MAYKRPEILLIKHGTRSPSTDPQTRYQIMDPDCAICSQPALAQCECEAKGLDIAVRQAEQRMMTSVFNDIRAWVRAHSQDHILTLFGHLTTRRKEHHAATLARCNQHAAYYYRSRRMSFPPLFQPFPLPVTPETKLTAHSQQHTPPR